VVLAADHAEQVREESTCGVDEESRLSAFEPRAIEHPEEVLGEAAPYGCPTCGGTLWEAPDDSVLRYRCRVPEAGVARSAAQYDRAVEEAETNDRLPRDMILERDGATE
jgi:two-component system, chemotaxis family, protein-glutamate methylesterase/glutaminase